MFLGKTIRLERILNRESGRTVIVPMDHGVTCGVPKGLEDVRAAVCDMAEGGADAVLMHKGYIPYAHRGSGRDLGLIMHLSASTILHRGSQLKTLVSTVEEALRQGADGVSIHVNLGNDDENKMLADFGVIARHCEDWGMPLLAMVYARGPHISDSFAPEVVAHCARVGAELGADIVKVSYTGDPESFARVIKTCHAPVVIAGGERTRTTRQVLERVRDAMTTGAIGISMGRNVFEHPRRVLMVKALCGMVHRNMSVEDALALVGE